MRPYNQIGNLYATGNCVGTTFVVNYPEFFLGMCLGRKLFFAKHVVEKLVKDGIPNGKGPSMAAPVDEAVDMTAENCADGTYTADAKGINGSIPVTVSSVMVSLLNASERHDLLHRHVQRLTQLHQNVETDWLLLLQFL